MPHGKFDPDKATDVQEAFWVGLTPQRVANMWAVADDWADLTADAKEFLRTAKPETLRFLKDARRSGDQGIGKRDRTGPFIQDNGPSLKWAIISTGTVLTAIIAIKTWLISKP